MGNSTPDETCHTTTISGFQNSFQSNIVSIQNVSSLVEVLSLCRNATSPLRVSVLILVLLTALPGNTALLWMMLKNRRALTPSELLGLNLALFSILFCLSLPINIYASLRPATSLNLISNAFSILVYFSCPVLLTGMCVERYMAVSHPVLFLRLGRWEYRAVSSVIIWTLTCSLAVVVYLYGIPTIALALSLILNMLFFLMLACLLGIVCVLCKKGPGEGRTGEPNDSPIKTRALKVIIAVIVPSTVTYMPLLALAPFLLVIQAAPHKISLSLICGGLQVFSALPGFGVCIGPMFYMSRIKRLLCNGNPDAGELRETRTDNQRN